MTKERFKRSLLPDNNCYGKIITALDSGGALRCVNTIDRPAIVWGGIQRRNSGSLCNDNTQATATTLQLQCSPATTKGTSSWVAPGRSEQKRRRCYCFDRNLSIPSYSSTKTRISCFRFTFPSPSTSSSSRA